MQEFLKSIQSPYWLLSVVVVGLLLNIISSYLRDFIDAFLSRLSKVWSTRTANRRKKRQNQITFLSYNKEAQEEMIREEFRNRIYCIALLIWGCTLLIIGYLVDWKHGDTYTVPGIILSYLCTFFSPLFLLLAASFLFKALDQESMVYEAKNTTVIIYPAK